ncbi:pre-toxin TG domain-containing protein, partial [Paenibacillus kandeliae]|uniref:pre-toxin TG domain-containing protein n=1 Tax=Paenibacillus kandeliae TaxID=3231269 RepID=UPI00345ADB87
MKLEVGLDSLTQASRSLDRAAREVEELKQELDQAKNSLSSKTRNTGSVESTFNRIHRQLDEMQQQLEQMSQLVSRKRDEYEEADRNGEDIDVGKMFSFALAAASLVLDFVPFVGNVKGIIEAVTGRDLLTGEKLEAWERVLGVMGPLGKGVSKAVKVAKYADEVVNVVGEATRHADDVTEAVSSATRNADNLAGSVSATSKGKTVTQAAENGADDFGSAGSKTSSKAGNSAEHAERSSEGMDAAPSSTKRSIVDSESAPYHNETVNATDHHSVASDATIAAVTGASALAATGKVSKTMNAADTSAEATKVTKNLEHTSDVSKKMANTEKSVQAQDVTKSNIKSCAVDPIHMATGHQFIDHDALSLYGAAVWPFRMLYHSGRLQQGALGKAWTHNYVVRLEIEDAAEQQQPAQEQSENQRTFKQDIQPSWITVHYTEGRRSVFHLQPSGVYRSKDLDVRQDELQSTEQGYVLTSRQPREVHTFDSEGRLIRVTNAEQLSLELTYDDEGLLTHLTDEITRRQFTLTYDEQHRVTSVRDAGRVIRMEYDDRGCFVRFTDATGIETKFTNDEYGRLISLTQDGITKFTNTFDDQHRIIGQSDASGHMSWLHYDLDSRPGQIVTILINRLGDQRMVVHNEQLQLLEVQEEDAHRTSYTYHENGQQASVTNALGETIRYEYDEHGQLIREIDPLEHVTEYSYTPDHLLSQIVDAEGSVTEYRYDEVGRQTAVVRPDGSSAYWSYTDSGQVEQYTDFNGGISRYDYDTQGNLRAYTDAAGRTTQVQLDDVGRITTLEDAAGGV